MRSTRAGFTRACRWVRPCTAHLAVGQRSPLLLGLKRRKGALGGISAGFCSSSSIACCWHSRFPRIVRKCSRQRVFEGEWGTLATRSGLGPPLKCVEDSARVAACVAFTRDLSTPWELCRMRPTTASDSSPLLQPLTRCFPFTGLDQPGRHHSSLAPRLPGRQSRRDPKVHRACSLLLHLSPLTSTNDRTDRRGTKLEGVR